ncbi:MAG: hypothetical protein Q9198_009822 [Flavoplaca austrocitrina]
MCEGEYESLKEIYQVSPDLVPKPFAWGRYREPQPEIYFLLAEFRDVGDQSEGRVLKPCLVHGDCWDGNTAMDIRTGEAFVFDVCSFYGHNEYDTGNWRAPRHRLSNKAYIRNYKKAFPVSEPGIPILSHG